MFPAAFSTASPQTSPVMVATADTATGITRSKFTYSWGPNPIRMNVWTAPS